MRRLGVALVAVLAWPLGLPAEEAAMGGETSPHTRYAEPQRPIEPFTLSNLDGRPVGFPGKQSGISLVFFGFTHCAQVCPATMQVLRHVRRPFEGEPGAPSIVLVSVDGHRDTPEAMKQFLAPFGEGFVGLTGDPALVRGIAARFSAVFFKGAPSDASGAYQVEHTSQVYLVDSSGRLRATFYGASAEEMAGVVRRISAETAATG